MRIILRYAREKKEKCMKSEAKVLKVLEFRCFFGYLSDRCCDPWLQASDVVKVIECEFLNHSSFKSMDYSMVLS